MNEQNKRLMAAAALVSVSVLAASALNCSLKTVYYTVESEKVGQKVRLVFVSDLHSCKYGEGQRELISAIAAQRPDAVLFGGDIFGSSAKLENALIVLCAAAKQCPSFFVTGNHERKSAVSGEVKALVRSCGATVLEGGCETIDVRGQRINICGADDPAEALDPKSGASAKLVSGAAENFRQLEHASEAAKNGLFTVLLAHRPELVETYMSMGFDLVLAGHAHGGQWRIPFVLNGLYAPNQGVFPQYAGGRYDFPAMTMLVSRGLARESTRIPRIWNRPELVVADVLPKK